MEEWEAKNKGRVLCLKFDNGQLKETITVASGMEHPNGLRDNSGNEIFIFECIRNCHITVIHIKTIYPADKQSRRIFDL